MRLINNKNKNMENKKKLRGDINSYPPLRDLDMEQLDDFDTKLWDSVMPKLPKSKYKGKPIIISTGGDLENNMFKEMFLKE